MDIFSGRIAVHPVEKFVILAGDDGSVPGTELVVEIAVGIIVDCVVGYQQRGGDEAIRILEHSDYDRIVELIVKDLFTTDPMDAYENKIFCKGAPLKTAVIWNADYIDTAR